MTESKHTRNIRYYGDNGIVIVEADGDLQCAHFADFAYVQESVCAHGGTAIDAVANLALTMRDISKAMQAGFNAAPELLAALEEAKQFIQNGIEYGYINTPEDEDVLARIKKAIRKAKGIDQ